MSKSVARNQFNITVLASRYQQPIADLVSRLQARPYAKPDRIGTNHDEGGYSISIVLLLVAMLESLLQRDRYFRTLDQPRLQFSASPPEYLKSTLRYRRHRHVRELFELRNAIAHNHMWEVHYEQPRTGPRRHNKSVLVPGTHRLPFPPKLGARIPRTPLCRFNLLPSRVDRTDVSKALSVSDHLLVFLSHKGDRPVNVARSIVSASQRRMEFSSLVRSLQDAL